MFTISVIIPAYNAQDTIIDTIKSVINQTYKCKYEIIVVNDGSKDKTEAVVDNFRTQNPDINIRIINQANAGVAAARNTGMRNASYDWIAFIDSDDEWLPDKIEKQVECIEKDQTIDFIGTEKVGHKTRIFLKEKRGLSKISLKEQFIKWYPPTSTYLFKKSIISKIGLMDESFRYGEDDEFLVRILQSFNGWFLSEPLVIYDHGKRGFGDSGLSKNLKKMQDGQRKVISRAYKNHILNPIEFVLARLYSEIKYIRRITLSKLKI